MPTHYFKVLAYSILDRMQGVMGVTRIVFDFKKPFSSLCRWQPSSVAGAHLNIIARLSVMGGGRAYYLEPIDVRSAGCDAQLSGYSPTLRGAWLDPVHRRVCLGSNRTDLRQWAVLFL
jgi:hypothetical protein